MEAKELNLVEILKNVPKGTELYSPICGECKLVVVKAEYDEIIVGNQISNYLFFKNGTYFKGYGECLLFPSKDNRDWSVFNDERNNQSPSFPITENEKSGEEESSKDKEYAKKKEDNNASRINPDTDKVMTDLALYAHFYRYIDYMIDDICYIDKENYESFVEKLPIKNSKTGFDAKVGYAGCLYFNIDNVAHLFKDFMQFKNVIKNEFRFMKKAGNSNTNKYEDKAMEAKEINLWKLLENVPKGTKLYSPLLGECELDGVTIEGICVRYKGSVRVFSYDGRYFAGCGECMLFPSKVNRDWDSFKVDED